VLVSGMMIGTVFTLFVVPSIYVLLARRRVVVAEARRSTRLPELAAAVSVALGIVFFATGASAQTAPSPVAAAPKVGPLRNIASPPRRGCSARGREQSGARHRAAGNGS